MSEKRITVALPEDLHARLRSAADREHRSLHAQMLVYIERGLDQDSPRRPRLGLGETELFGQGRTQS